MKNIQVKLNNEKLIEKQKKLRIMKNRRKRRNVIVAQDVPNVLVIAINPTMDVIHHVDVVHLVKISSIILIISLVKIAIALPILAFPIGL
jgi:hypothetical protein